VEVDPTAEVVGGAGDGQQRMELGAELSTANGEGRLSGVEVAGFDMAGREVCRVDTGTWRAAAS